MSAILFSPKFKTDGLYLPDYLPLSVKFNAEFKVKFNAKCNAKFKVKCGVKSIVMCSVAFND